MINGRRRTRIIIWAVALALAALAAVSAFAQTSTLNYVVNGNTSTGGLINAPVGTCTTCVSMPITGSITTSPGTPTPIPSTNISGTVTTGGTFQTILAANTTTRKGCTIENPTTASEALSVFASTGAAATVATAFTIAPGSTFSCTLPGGAVISDAIQVTATTTGHAFVGNSQ